MKKYFKKILVLLICIIIPVTNLSGCSGSAITTTKTDFYFDTVITITLYNSKKSIIDECFKLCDKYEKMFSTTIPDSDISLINSNSKNGEYTTVSNETIELLTKSIEYCELSNGKFDITIGKLTSLWDFGATTDQNIPNASDLEKYADKVGYEQIKIDGNKVLLINPDISLDLGGVAKGFIADKLKEYLLSKGVKQGIINLGGNVLLIGSKKNNENYNIGIQYPFESEGSTITVVSAKDKSIVTSGIYERYFYKDNILYHHILDSQTGYPINNDLLSVTIISSKSIDGDILSTTAFVNGLEDGIKLIEKLDGIEAIFIDKDYEIHLTSGLTESDGVVTLK